jgi:NADH-quinone oxidoreductase subunit H
MDLTVPPSPRLRRADRVAEPVGAGRPEGVVSSGRRGTGTGTTNGGGTGRTGSTAASAQEGTDA